MGPGTLCADLHGKTKYQVRVTVDALLRRRGRGPIVCGLSTGFTAAALCGSSSGAQYSSHPKVKRLLLSPDGGATELVLREY